MDDAGFRLAQAGYSVDSTAQDQSCRIAFDYPEEKMLRKRGSATARIAFWRNRLKGPTLGVWGNRLQHDRNRLQRLGLSRIRRLFRQCALDENRDHEGTLTMMVPMGKTFVRVGTPKFRSEIAGRTMINFRPATSPCARHSGDGHSFPLPPIPARKPHALVNARIRAPYIFTRSGDHTG